MIYNRSHVIIGPMEPGQEITGQIEYMLVPNNKLPFIVVAVPDLGKSFGFAVKATDVQSTIHRLNLKLQDDVTITTGSATPYFYHVSAFDDCSVAEEEAAPSKEMTTIADIRRSRPSERVELSM